MPESEILDIIKNSDKLHSELAIIGLGLFKTFNAELEYVSKVLAEIVTQQNKLANILLEMKTQVKDLERDQHSHPNHYGN